MRIDHSPESCLLCPAGSEALSWEHVLPESLGGRLEANLLCGPCNNQTGSRLVAQWKQDPSIVLAVRALAGDLPKMYDAFYRDQTYTAPGPDGEPLVIKGGRVKTRKGSDGSLIVDESETGLRLEEILRKRGDPPAAIRSAVESVRDAPLDTLREVAPGVSIVRRTTPDAQLALSHLPLVDERAPTLIALEYLAMVGWGGIRDGGLDHILDPIREYVRGGPRPMGLQIERLQSATGYAPFHELSIRSSEQASAVGIVLFGWLVFRATIRGITFVGPCPTYREEIDTGRSLLAPMRTFYHLNPSPSRRK